MKINPASGYDCKSYFTRITRSGGGIYIGLRIDFPWSIWDGPNDADNPSNWVPTNTTYQSILVDVGLLLWRLSFFIEYGHKPITTP